MSHCWASAISLCSGKITREHIVSKGLFENEVVKVQGFSWCKDSPKEIGLSSLTAKILCKKHNEDLSEVDTSGSNAFDSIREMRRIANIRGKVKPKMWNIIKYSIDGNLLERWFLKTLINISYCKEYSIGGEAENGKPINEIIKIAYGKSNFSGRAGLYSIVHVGQQINSTDSFLFSPVIKDKKYIAGGLFSFRGFKYLLFLMPEGPPKTLDGVFLNGEDIGKSQLNFHNTKINENTGKYLSQIVNIKWSSKM